MAYTSYIPIACKKLFHDYIPHYGLISFLPLIVSNMAWCRYQLPITLVKPRDLQRSGLAFGPWMKNSISPQENFCIIRANVVHIIWHQDKSFQWTNQHRRSV